MNKIFKVIWNHATQSWIVTSEISKSHGKTASSKLGGFAINHISGVRFAYTAIASTLLILSGQVVAATGTEYQSGTDNICYYDTTTFSVICGDSTTSVTNTGNSPKSVAIGMGAASNGESNVAVGRASYAAGTAAIALGNSAQANANSSIAIGNTAQSNAAWDISIGREAGLKTTPSAKGEGRNIAIGDGALRYATAPNNNIAMGTGAGESMTSKASVVIGTYANGLTANKEILKATGGVSANNVVAIGDRALATKDSAVAVGNRTQATGLSATAIGTSTNASANYAVAQGANAQATEGYSVAIGGAGNTTSSARATTNPFTTAVGYNSLATGRHATALGSTTSAVGFGSTAVGAGASTTKTGSIAISAATDNGATQRTTASGNNAVAIGVSATASADNAIAQGTSANAGVANAIAIGTSAQSTSADTIAIGNASNTGSSQYGIVIGSEATLNTTANSGKNTSIAIGYKTAATGLDSIAIGRQHAAAADGAIAIGTQNTLNGVASIGIGQNVKVAATDGIAIGNTAKAGAGENNTAIGSYANANVGWSTALGTRAYTNANGALAAGTMASAEEQRATAIGSYSFAEGLTSTALGYHTVATSNASAGTALGTGTLVDGAQSGAWGAVVHANPTIFDNTKRSIIGGTGNYAIGNQNLVGNQTTNSVVFGNNIKIGAESATVTTTNQGGKGNSIAARTETVTYTGAKALANAVAIGNSSSVAGNQGVAVGYKSTAATEDSIAIGNSATVTVDNGVALGSSSVASTAAGQTGADPLSAKDAAASAGVWKATHAAVSVGNGTTVTRQITSVAAGTQDTDAVNVAQLKAAGFTLAATASDGELGGAVANDKIQNGETVTVDAGKNIKVTHTANQVSIATKDEVEFTQITLGDSTNNTVLTSTTDGLDVGGDKITNVANGDVSANSKEAINGSQLYTTNQNVANNATAIANNATEIAKGLNFGANDQTATSNTAINRKLGDTIGIKGGITDTSTATSGENVITRTDANGNINIELAKNAKFDSVTTGGTKLSDAGLSFVDTSGSPVANSPSISNTGINAGNQVIAGVKAGTQDTDAVNVAQLNAKTATTPLTVGNTGAVDALAPADTNKLVTASDIANAINNSGFNLQANGDTASLVKAGDKVQFLNGDNIEITRNGNDITVATAKDVSFNSVTAGTGTNQVVLDNDGVKVGGNTYISNAGLNANDKKVTNVANGDVTSASKDAINGSQLHAVSTATKNLIGGNATVNSDGTVTASNIGGTGATTIDNAIKTVKTTVKSTDNTIKVTANPADATNGTVFDISVDSQKLAESAQLPVVYTDADGNKVYKVGGKFTKDPTGQDATKEVSAANVIASMQNADGTTSTATKLANIAKGDVSSNSKDAINGSQLFAQGEGVKNIIGGNTTYDPTTGTYTNNNIGGTGKGNINDAIQTVNTKADTNATEIAKGLNFGANDQTATAGDAIKRQLGETIGIKGGITDTSTATSGENVITRTDANGNINIELAKNAKFDSVTTGGTKLSDAGLSFVDTSGSPVANSPSISNTGINAGNQVIAGVKAGTQDTDAVNVAQLNAKTATTPLTVGNTGAVDALAPADTNKLVTASDIANAINNSGFNLQANGDTASLVKAGDKVQFLNGDNIEITRNGNDITVATAKDVSFNSVTAGTGTNQVVLDNDGVKVGGNTYISNAGLNANDKKVTNVANGDVTSASKDAINGSQLHAVSTATKNLIGGNATVNSDGTVTASNIGGTGATTIDNAIKTVKTTVKSTDNTIKVTANPADATNGTVFDISVDSQKLAESAQLPVVYTDADGNKVYKVGGKFTKDPTGQDATKEVSAANVIASMQNADGTISPTTLANIKAGTNDTDAVNVSQLKGAVDALGGGAAINTDGTIKAPTYNITNPAKGTVTTANNVGAALDSLNSAVNSPLTFKGDSGEFNRNLGQTTTVKGGITDTAKLSDNNIGVVAKDGTLDIKLAKDIAVDSVKTGDTTVNTYGVSIANADPNKVVSLTAGGLNNGNNRITNVAAGQAGTDAVNKDQLDKAQAAATTKVAAGDNIVVTPSQNADGSTTYTVATADEVAFDKATVGNVTIDSTTNKISGLANGDVSASSTDAVNGSQLYYTNRALGKLADVVNKNNLDLRAGVAGANAAAGLPQVYLPGKSMVAASAGTYRGQSALAVGYSRSSDNGKLVLKVQGNANTRGEVGGSVGIGYQW